MRLTFFVTCLGLAISAGSAHAEISVSLECKVTGLGADGRKLDKPFVELLKIERKEHEIAGSEGKPKKVIVSSAELFSNGVKQNPHIAAATVNYAVLVNAVEVGEGFGRRLLVFTYLLDLKAMRLTRVVNSLPQGSDERTESSCRVR